MGACLRPSGMSSRGPSVAAGRGSVASIHRPLCFSPLRCRESCERRARGEAGGREGLGGHRRGTVVAGGWHVEFLVGHPFTKRATRYLQVFIAIHILMNPTVAFSRGCTSRTTKASIVYAKVGGFD